MLKKTIFDFPEVTTEDLNKIIKSLNPNKTVSSDRIPLKIIKTDANVIDSHLAYIINKDLKENKFSENAKTALVRPIYKKDDKGKIKNYIPVSLLKIVLMKDSYMVVYPTSQIRYFPNLFQLIESLIVQIIFFQEWNEEWKKSLDDKNIIGAVLMDLSKAFDCIPHDLLMAKLYTFGLYMDAITFIYSYMKRRKQGVKINDTESLFKILLSGLPQGSILGPILFNIFINDLLFFTKLANFADDNTIYAAKRDLNELLRLLKKESEVAIKWFSDNNMIVNPKKYQASIINRQNRSNHNCWLTKNNAEINSKE